MLANTWVTYKNMGYIEEDEHYCEICGCMYYGKRNFVKRYWYTNGGRKKSEQSVRHYTSFEVCHECKVISKHEIES